MFVCPACVCLCPKCVCPKCVCLCVCVYVCVSSVRSLCVRSVGGVELTGYLLNPVEHHKGIGEANLHGVIDRADD